MSHADPGPLAGYNSLQDKHLAGYFNNTRMRRHLRRAGLITKNGDLVTETTYRLNMARKEHQKHVRDLLAQAIVHKALDIERHRQSDIKKKLEEIAKIELVRRVRMEKAHQGDEDIVPYLSPRSRRPKSAVEPTSKHPPGNRRPYTAPSKRPKSSKKKSTVYVDKDGFPVHRIKNDPDSDSQDLDSSCLKGLDSHALNKASLHMTEEPDTGGKSPYKLDYALSPQPPKSGRGSRSTSGRNSRRPIYTKDGKRVRAQATRGGGSTLHRREPAYSHAVAPQTMCDVTVRYRGQSFKVSYEKEDNRDEIMIYQQHCGGENLVVFHGWVEPGTDCVFTSRRHRGYPFGMTFFVNRVQVLTISACCEYKYKPGVILGGRKGHFRYVTVEGASPCYKCLVEAELAKRERDRYKGTQTEPPPPDPEPELVTDAKATQADANDDEEIQEGAVDAGTAYDNDDFEDDEEDDMKGKENEENEDKKADVKTDEPKEEQSQNEYEEDLFEDDDVKESANEKEISDHESEKEKEEDVKTEEETELVSDDGSKKDERDSEMEIKTEASDNERKIDSSDNEGRKEKSDNESKMETSDNDSRKEKSDNENKAEASDNESRKEKSDNESKMDTSDNESRKEQSDNENKIEASDNESRKEKSDNENKMEASDNKSRKEQSDNENKMVTNNESKTETSDNESIKERFNTQRENNSRDGDNHKNAEEKEQNSEEKRISEDEERKDEDKISTSSYVIEKDGTNNEGLPIVNGDLKDEEQTLEQKDESSDHESEQEKGNKEAGEAVEGENSEKNDAILEEAKDNPIDENYQYADESEPESIKSVSATSDSVHSERAEGRKTSFGQYNSEEVITDTEEEKKNEDDVDSKTDEVNDTDRWKKEDRIEPVGGNDEVTENDEKGNNSDQESLKEQHINENTTKEKTIDSEVENESGNVLENQDRQQILHEKESSDGDKEPELGSNAETNDVHHSDHDVGDEKQNSSDHQVERANSQSSVNSALKDADIKEQKIAASEEEDIQSGRNQKMTEDNENLENKPEDNGHENGLSRDEEVNKAESNEDKDVHHQEQTSLGSKSSLQSNPEKTTLNHQTSDPETSLSKATPEESVKSPQATDSHNEDKEPTNEDASASKPESKRPGSATSSSSSSSSSSSASSSDSDSENSKENSTDQKTLDFSKRDLSSRGARKVARALTKPENQNIESLILSENPIGDRGIKTVIRALTDQQKDQLEDGKKPKLSEINLSNCKIGNSGIEEISKFLKDNSTVMNLNLSSNPDIEVDGWKHLADVLQNDQNLKSLNVSDCWMGGDAGSLLLLGLVDNESLLELDIEGNNLGIDGGRCLVDLVKDNGVISSIQFVRGNNIAPNTTSEIKEILETGSFVP